MGRSAAYGAFAGADQLRIDRAAFGISVAEARSLDPQQRLVLRVGYGVLLGSRGGSTSPFGGATLRDALTNSAVGVFVGVEASGLAAAVGELGVFSTSGGALSITSGRLSYTLGLVGPCYSVDTACASALAALHVCACAVGVGGECDEGVGMGTKVLSEASNYATSAGGMTSPHGRCHTFDRRADGYCRGEGCGAFLVSSPAGWRAGVARSVLSLVGSAVQQDGPSASLTAPNGSSQRRLLETVRRAIPEGGVPILEAHGTGTALGDPIEVTRAALLEGRWSDSLDRAVAVCRLAPRTGPSLCVRGRPRLVGLLREGAAGRCSARRSSRTWATWRRRRRPRVSRRSRWGRCRRRSSSSTRSCGGATGVRRHPRG